MENLRFELAPRDGETAGDIAFRRLRSDIVNGRHAPLAKLKLESLRESYATSVTTLREILNRLVAERLVIAEGQRGFRVAPISRTDLKGLADLRVLLETFALTESIAQGDLEWQGNVVSAHFKLSVVEAELIGGDRSSVDQWVRHDWGFHHATIAACAAVPLMETHTSIFDRYARYHMLVLNFRGKPAADQHERLRDFVLARRTDAAVALLKDHILSGMQHILDAGKIPG